MSSTTRLPFLLQDLIAELQRSGGDLDGAVVITLPPCTFDAVERDLVSYFGGDKALVIDRGGPLATIRVSGVLIRRGA